jgi:hypothetical protein
VDAALRSHRIEVVFGAVNDETLYAGGRVFRPVAARKIPDKDLENVRVEKVCGLSERNDE